MRSSTRPTRACSEVVASTEPFTAPPVLTSSTECRLLGGCKTGEAKITGAGNLQAKYVIHAVGPVWRGGGEGEAEALASCYSQALDLAAEHECRTIALPAISTGVYAYPLDEAAEVAIASVRAGLDRHASIDEARFWLFGESAYDAFARRWPNGTRAVNVALAATQNSLAGWPAQPRAGDVRDRSGVPRGRAR